MLAGEWISGGNPEQMYYSLTSKLMALPDDTILFPVITMHACRTRLSASRKRRSLPQICFPETVFSGDGISVIASTGP